MIRLAAAAFVLAFFAIPRITGTLELSVASSAGPAENVDATISVSGSCIDRGRPWTYRFCCEGPCPPGVEGGVGQPGEGLYTGTLPASTPSVFLDRVCDYPDVGVHTATAVVTCWLAPTDEATDTLEVTAP